TFIAFGGPQSVSARVEGGSGASQDRQSSGVIASISRCSAPSFRPLVSLPGKLSRPGPAHWLAHANFPHALPNHAGVAVLFLASDGMAEFLPPGKRLPCNAFRVRGRPERHRAPSFACRSLLYKLDEPTADSSTLLFSAHVDVHKFEFFSTFLHGDVADDP